MGHIQKRGDRKYQARWVDPDGCECAQTFPRKEDAKRHLASVEAAKLQGAYVDVTSKITVTEKARECAAIRPHRATTAARTKSLIDTHIANTPLGARRLSAVRPSEVQAWVTDRSRVLSPSTLRLVVSFLRSVFNAAMRDRLVTFNPCVGLTLPRAEYERIVPLTVEQVAALSSAVQPRCRAMIIAQTGLGLRIAELLALRVQDVDFLRRTARIEWQLTRDGKDLVDPKTPRSRRTVPLPNVVSEALAEHIRVYPVDSGDFLFTSSRGNPYRQLDYVRRVFNPAVQQTGLAGITSHDLRHHYASVLLAAGESVVAVAERLGDTPQMALKVYGHIMPDSEDKTRRAIDAAWISDGPGTDGGDRPETSFLASN
jgi:integrase